MKLILQQQQHCNVITQQVQQGKEPEYYLQGIFIQANLKNRNGRIYPMEVMEPQIQRYKKEYIDTKRAFGQLNHPDGCNINLQRVSHLITDIWRQGNYFKGRAKILDTPYGKIVKTMIKQGCQLGVSSRGVGSITRRDGIDVVGDDFRLITAGDIVWEPSAQTAFPNGIMEGVQWDYDPQTGEYYCKQQKSLTEQENKQLSKLQLEKFKDFLNTLKKD